MNTHHFEEEADTLADYLDVLRRRKWQMVPPALAILIVGLGAALLIPPEYQAEATILIEQQEIPQDLVRSTITTFADQRIQVISQRVMTSANIVQMVDKFNLYPEERENKGLATILQQVRSAIGVDMVAADVVDPRTGRPSQATVAFKVSFRHRSAQTSQRVTNELVSLFLSENLKSRTASVAETQSFLESQAQILNSEVLRLEKEMGDFRSSNTDYLPEMAMFNVSQMERAERQLMDTQGAIRSLEERLIYLNAELTQIDPNEVTSGPEERLEELSAEYLTVTTRYSENHPTRARMGREIAALESQVSGRRRRSTELQTQLQGLRGDLVEQLESYSPEHPDVKNLERRIAALEEELQRLTASSADPTSTTRPNNPAYVQLRAQARVAEIELQSLRLTEAELNAKIADFEGRVARAPHVERELNRLSREYQNAAAEYRGIRSKEVQAELAESLERGRKGERLSLVEPPLLPTEPVKPNRPLIAFVSFVLSIAGGVGTMAILESMDGTFHSARGVTKVLGEPPLALIPFHRTRAERRAAIVRRAAFGGLAGAIAAGAIALVHLQFIPLDVLWYSLAQRVGIATG